MKDTVEIDFKMIITTDDQKQEISFTDLGQRYIKNNKTYVKFNEPQMDYPEKIAVTLICAKNDIVIIRNGSVKMKQQYTVNELTTGSFTNHYLTTEINTYTNKYDYAENKIFLDYDMIIDQTKVGNFQMEVRIKEVNYE